MIELPPLLRTPLPDEAHEALRVANELAILDLASQTVSMEDFRLALRVLNGAVITLNQIAESYAAALPASVADRAQLNARVAALEARTLRGTTGTGTVTSLLGGTTNLSIALKTPMPSADYIALPIVDATTGVNLSAVTATVQPGKTASAVPVRLVNSGLALLQTVNVTVVAVQLS